MTVLRRFVLAHDNARNGVGAYALEAPEGTEVIFKEPTRTSDQNAKLHKTLQSVSAQVVWCGKKLDITTWKRLCTAAWLRESGEQPTLIPALDGNGFDIIFERTSRLTLTQCSSLIEWILSFGSEHGVDFDV